MTVGLEFKLTSDVVNEAYEHALKRIVFEYNRADYTEEQRISMIMLGTIGQLGFKSVLDNIGNINYIHQLQAGKYDDFDFTIDDQICEIKTSGFDSSGWERLSLLYSESQFKAGMIKKFAYCFQLFINGYDRETRLLDLKSCNTLIIGGYIEFPKIANFENKTKKFWGDHYKVPLSDLSCFENFNFS